MFTRKSNGQVNYTEISMLKAKKTIISSVITATVAIGAYSFSAHAVDVPSKATVTVLSAFTVDETQPLSFGTLAVKKAGTGETVAQGDSGKIIIKPSGEVDVSGASVANKGSLISIVDGTHGIFDISNAAPNASIQITGVDGHVTLAHPSGTGGSFHVDAFNYWDLQSGFAVTTSIETNDEGLASLGLGATISLTAGVADETFTDGVYTGDYSFSLAY